MCAVVAVNLAVLPVEPVELFLPLRARETAGYLRVHTGGDDGSQEGNHNDNHDGDQRQDERVFHQSLTIYTPSPLTPLHARPGCVQLEPPFRHTAPMRLDKGGNPSHLHYSRYYNSIARTGRLIFHGTLVPDGSRCMKVVRSVCRSNLLDPYRLASVVHTHLRWQGRHETGAAAGGAIELETAAEHIDALPHC